MKSIFWGRGVGGPWKQIPTPHVGALERCAGAAELSPSARVTVGEASHKRGHLSGCRTTSKNFFLSTKEERDCSVLQSTEAEKSREKSHTTRDTQEHGVCGWRGDEFRLDRKGPECQEKHLGFIPMPCGATGGKSGKYCHRSGRLETAHWPTPVQGDRGRVASTCCEAVVRGARKRSVAGVGR